MINYKKDFLMDSILTDTLNTINHLRGRIQYLEQQIANLQAANADLSSNNNYLRALLVSSPDPNTVPQTVLEVGEQPSKRPREEPSNEQLVFKPLEQSFGNSDGFASYEETNRLLEDYPYDENDGFWDFVRNLYEESHPEEKDI